MIKKVKVNQRRCIYFLIELKRTRKVGFTLDVTNKTPRCDKRDTSDVTAGNINKNYITKINNNIDSKNFLNFNNRFSIYQLFQTIKIKCY